MELTVLCVSFAILLLLGVPVAFAIGLSSVATILAAGLPIAVVFQKMVGGMQVFSFLAIPFFIFAGELMLYGGIAERIVRFANSLVGHVRGGLGMSNVLGCTLFGGVVGSPVADVSAMGSVMIPLMKREGYDADYAVNVTTHAALVGALMPTSHNLILFTLATSGIASVSVIGLILAGLVPALILTLCNLTAAWWVARRRGYPVHGGRHPVRHLHRDRVSLDCRGMGAADHRARLSVAFLEPLSRGLRQGLQDHRGGAASHRHFGSLWLFPCAL
jgi:tripartite ATP-independent transporter DctM subunit